MKQHSSMGPWAHGAWRMAANHHGQVPAPYHSAEGRSGGARQQAVCTDSDRHAGFGPDSQHCKPGCLQARLACRSTAAPKPLQASRRTFFLYVSTAGGKSGSRTAWGWCSCISEASEGWAALLAAWVTGQTSARKPQTTRRHAPELGGWGVRIPSAVSQNVLVREAACVLVPAAAALQALGCGR